MKRLHKIFDLVFKLSNFQTFKLLADGHMDYRGRPSQSSDTVLSSILSLYLLSDPPAPSSALPTILHLITDRKPFINIDSNSQILHKWNTRISSLIQSKSAESRYWGICLAKATISNGGEGVAHAVVWVKLLLTLLNVRYACSN
jgi:hypothetical protein